MIKEIRVLKDPKYIEPVEIIYEQNTKTKRWEAVKAHDSVAVLLYHPQKDVFVLVKQFRPALYMQHGFEFSYELCAGIVDKEKSLEQIAIEEVEEETGYQVEKIEKITSFFTSVGFAGSKQTLYYAEVTTQIADGGGIDDEVIEVVYLPVAKAREFMYDESKPKTPGLLFALCWWFERNSQ
ncbi:UDP-sugar diphosphatase [Nitratiruptor sp. YY08-26]|uniref:NUDIX domain-containing protein n=1 Tax=unclassified Nitratiruptor TaxID=2624044 RepID=UPI001916BD50|nr:MULTISPECIES: NUDIX hydrolase [unclassified Nitratiruptor]BCD61508.1 UDP-sugar diphosphatase [Nitratiruptor sp. YY08-13]BCD65442.1 UDP-sugar diphosphatase [Nitratiruptor sp. YY08-26]